MKMFFHCVKDSVRKYKTTSYFSNISKLYGKSFPTTPGTINNGGRLTVPSLTVPHKHYNHTLPKKVEFVSLLVEFH